MFPKITDRLQQGLLDELYLGRAMISPSGFTTDPAFHQDGTLASASVLNTSHLYYNGNSQGGIMGGALPPSRPTSPRIARRAGDELLGAAAALGRLRQVRSDPLPRYPDEASAPADPRPDADALGPWRAGRLRGSG